MTYTVDITKALNRLIEGKADPQEQVFLGIILKRMLTKNAGKAE